MGRLPIAAFVALFAFGGDAAARDLRISHQWNTNDIRHAVAKVLADEVAKSNTDLTIKIFPKRELYKPREQYEPLMSGELDMSIYPLAYSGKRHPEYNLTLMPGLVKNHDHASRLVRSEFMGEIEEILAKDDLMVLIHGYLAGGFAGTEGCVKRPTDIDGKVARAAGAAFESMLSGAGATIKSMPSSRIYDEMDAGALQVANTSSASFVSFKLYEQVRCFTPAGDYALWFMYHPVLMNKSTFDALTPAQQTALLSAARKAETYFSQEAVKQDDLAR
ncbi:MAG: TRAP transporter substrate-binding protein DctP, partial [Pseudomonadota bacterium]